MFIIDPIGGGALPGDHQMGPRRRVGRAPDIRNLGNPWPVGHTSDGRPLPPGIHEGHDGRLYNFEGIPWTGNLEGHPGPPRGQAPFSKTLDPGARHAILTALAGHYGGHFGPETPRWSRTSVADFPVRHPARMNPAAANYAQRMLGRLARVGYTSDRPNPVDAWGDVSARFSRDARAAGYADPRQYVIALLRGRHSSHAGQE